MAEEAFLIAREHRKHGQRDGDQQQQHPGNLVGTKDDVVLPEWTRQLVPRALAAGDSIKGSFYEGATHRSVLEAAKPEILHWIDDRLSGKPAQSDMLAN